MPLQFSLLVDASMCTAGAGEVGSMHHEGEGVQRYCKHDPVFKRPVTDVLRELVFELGSRGRGVGPDKAAVVRRAQDVHSTACTMYTAVPRAM
jgi:hypothetical protein